MQTLNEIRQHYNLPEIAKQAGVELKHSGRGFLGICPFHKDSRPSFSIFPAEGTWHFKCHGGSCGAKGDVIDFVGRLEFGDAWDASSGKMLKQAIQSLKKNPTTSTVLASTGLSYHKKTEHVIFIWKLALHFYQKELEKSHKAKFYLTNERKLPEYILDKWQFGYCPSGGSELISLGAISREDAVYSGLVKEGKTSYYEFMYDRIVFADVDESGKPVYIHGRALKPDRNKYLGIPNFKKPIFGANLDFRDSPLVLLMEGPINAMVAHYWGYNALAVAGTSLSSTQTEMIRDKLQGRTLRPVPQNDNAGKKALQKWQEEIEFLGNPVYLPSNCKDLNDLHVLEENGKEIFYKRVMR